MTELERTVSGFMDCFNNADLEGAMSYFGTSASYIDEFNNTHKGHAAIRSTLGAILGGEFGALTYSIDDTIFDEEKSRALVLWTLRIENTDTPPVQMRGLDIIDVDGHQVTCKNCYIKAKEVLVENAD